MQQQAQRWSQACAEKVTGVVTRCGAWAFVMAVPDGGQRMRPWLEAAVEACVEGAASSTARSIVVAGLRGAGQVPAVESTQTAEAL